MLQRSCFRYRDLTVSEKPFDSVSVLFTSMSSLLSSSTIHAAEYSTPLLDSLLPQSLPNAFTSEYTFLHDVAKMTLAAQRLVATVGRTLTLAG